MRLEPLASKAGDYLRHLCLRLPSRRVGSPGNRQATDFFAQTLAACGFTVETSDFECMDWEHSGARLSAAGRFYPVHPSPYSLGCNLHLPLAAAASLDELQQLAAHHPETRELPERILLLRGELTREPLMPKNFPFYNPESHRQIIALLETIRPAAIIAAAAREAQTVGSQYPFPLFEDGDFDIPSVYMSEEDGARLAQLVGQTVSLESRARRIPSSGCNVIGRKGGEAPRRLVFSAHIDAHLNAPGAIDNASGVVVLLLLTELLAGYAGELRLELTALNGEDYYSNPGEQLYLAQNAGRFDEIILGVNLDGVGYRKGRMAFSLYGCPDELAASIRQVFAACPELIEGSPWYQGDHSLFVINGVPAAAVTSELAEELTAQIIHTPHDTPEQVDPAQLARLAQALHELILALERTAL